MLSLGLSLRFRVFGLRVLKSLGLNWFKIQGLGFRMIKGAEGCRVQFKIQGLGFRVSGFGSRRPRTSGSACRPKPSCKQQQRWGFPKTGDPNIVPSIVGSLLRTRTPKYSTLNSRMLIIRTPN